MSRIVDREDLEKLWLLGSAPAQRTNALSILYGIFLVRVRKFLQYRPRQDGIIPIDNRTMKSLQKHNTPRAGSLSRSDKNLWNLYEYESST